MKNFLETQIQGTELPEFSYVAGCEKLSVTEHLKSWFGGIYLGIQKIYSKFTFNIHKVDMNKELATITKDTQLFYKHLNTAFPVPEYFVKSPGWMSDYVLNLKDTPILLNLLITETEVMYSRMKRLASTGKMPPQFRWVITDTVRVMERAEAFMSGLTQSRGEFLLKEVYVNPAELMSTVSSFNTTVQHFKSRDAEMLSKSLNRVYDIASVVTEKMAANDIVVSESDIQELQVMFKDYSRLANTAGAMLVLLNEFSAVMVDTKETLKKLQ